MRELSVKERRIVPVLEAVTKNHRMVLLGDPGSGKSTFVNFLAARLAENIIDPKQYRLNDLLLGEAYLVPIKIQIRQFALYLTDKPRKKPSAVDIWDFVEWSLGSKNLQASIASLKNALDSGRAYIFFDGLDEAPPTELRALIRDSILEFVSRYPNNRYLVTCRTLTYQSPETQLKDFPFFRISPFDTQQINKFIQARYAELAQVGTISLGDARNLTALLQEAVSRPDLKRLAHNPLLLTVMTLLHTHKGRLPDARALLYEETVDILLWRWEQNKLGGPTSRLRQYLLEAHCTDIDLKRVLWELAFKAQAASKLDNVDNVKEAPLADIYEFELEQAIATLKDNDFAWATKVVDIMKARSGLLLERAPDIFTFPHRTFQEYLAAAYLTEQSDFASKVFNLARQGTFWWEVVLYSVSRLIYVSGELDKPLELVGELCSEKPGNDNTSWRLIWLAGKVLQEIGINRVRDSQMGHRLLDRVQRHLSRLLTENALESHERIGIGITLAAIGDPRFDAENFYLPNDDLLGFKKISAGDFWMGADIGEDDEKPSHRVNAPEYWMAQYPVTVGQFQAFVNETGYQPKSLESMFEPSTYPVTNITWLDALSYCQWLNGKLKEIANKKIYNKNQDVFWQGIANGALNVILPTELFWEKAAKGSLDNRKYPWGMDIYRISQFNRPNEAKKPVGCFPEEASPYGIMDMLGNVKEWTQSLLERYPYDRVDGREDIRSIDKKRAVRGSTYITDSNSVATRYSLFPTGANPFIGFRVAIAETTNSAPIPVRVGEYAEIQNFLSGAGLEISDLAVDGFICISNRKIWSDITPAYVRLITGQSLDIDLFAKIKADAEKIFDNRLAGHTIILVIDNQPRQSDLHHISGLKSQVGVKIIPLPISTVRQSLLVNSQVNTLETLKSQYTGREDLYSISFPVSDVLSFFGRSAYMADVIAQLNKGNPVIVYGSRRVGKSSLLERLSLERSLPPAAVVNLQETVTDLKNVYKEVIRKWCLEISQRFPEDVIPNWVSGWDQTPKGKVAEAFKNKILEILGFLSGKVENPGLCLFIDELDAVMKKRIYLDLTSTLKSLVSDSQIKGKLSFLVVALDPALDKTDFIGKNRNPFYGFLTQMPIEPLTEEETRQMVTTIGAFMEISYSPDALELIGKVGGGNPFLVRRICSKAIEGLDRPGVVDEPKVEKTVNVYLSDPSNHFAESLWMLKSGGPPKHEAKILSQLAFSEPQHEDDLLQRKTVPNKEFQSLQFALQHLLDMKIVKFTDDGYSYTIPLYRKWVRKYILKQD